MKFFCPLYDCPPRRNGIAPAVTRPVVGADAGELRNLILDRPPESRGFAGPLFNDHSRGDSPFAKQVQLVVSDGNHAPGRRIAPFIPPFVSLLIEIARYQEKDAG